MTTQKIIIIEGADRVGKSGIAKTLSERLGIPINPREAPSFGYSSLICGGVAAATCNIMSQLRKTGASVIFDRCHLSEYVYGKLNRNYDETENMLWFEAEESFMKGLDVTLILVKPSDPELSSKFHGSDIRPAAEEFARIFEKSKIGKKVITTYNFGYISENSIMSYIMKEKLT